LMLHTSSSSPTFEQKFLLAMTNLLSAVTDLIYFLWSPGSVYPAAGVALILLLKI
jgi:hypothetical protein